MSFSKDAKTEAEQLLGQPIPLPRVLRLTPRFHQEFRLINDIMEQDGRLKGREFYVLLVAERDALDRVTRVELPAQQASHGRVTADSESVAQIAARLQESNDREVLIGSAHWHPGALSGTGFLSPQDMELLNTMAEEMSPQLLEFIPAAERPVKQCSLRLTPHSELRLDGDPIAPSLLGVTPDHSAVLSVSEVHLQEPQAQSIVHAIVNAGENYFGRCLVTRYCPSIVCRAPKRTIEPITIEVESASEKAQLRVDRSLWEALVNERIEPTRFWIWKNWRNSGSSVDSSREWEDDGPVAAVQEQPPAALAAAPEASVHASPAEQEPESAESASAAEQQPEPLAVAIAAAGHLVEALQQMMYERAQQHDVASTDATQAHTDTDLEDPTDGPAATCDEQPDN